MAIVRSEPEVVDFLGDRRRRRAEGSCGRGVATRPATCPTLPHADEKFAIMEILTCGFDVLEA
jgi:hypothetical protein